MSTLIELLQSLPQILGPILATTLGLIALDLGLGIAIALRQGVFQWEKVILFYRTNVFPFGIAAIVIAAAAQFISFDILPPHLADPLADLGTLIGVGPMFAYLVLGSILPNVRALVLGKYKWEIVNPEWAMPGAAMSAGVEETVDDIAAALDAIDAATADQARGVRQDIAALNEDGTALDQYDPETLAHVGSDSLPPDTMEGSIEEAASPKVGAGL